MNRILPMLRFIFSMSFAVILSFGCGNKKNDDLKLKPSSNLAADSLGDKLVKATVSTIHNNDSNMDLATSTETTSVSLNLTSYTPRAILLDASNLEAILRPVFSTYGQISNTDTQYFSPDDKFKLGEFSFLSIPNQVKARVGGHQTLSQDYIFAMRKFAGRACTNLVLAERNNPSNPSNRLINDKDWNAKKVSVETINRFMDGIFGYSASSGAFQPGAQELATVFNDAITADLASGSSRGTSRSMSNNYVLACVYVVTDPRTFSR